MKAKTSKLRWGMIKTYLSTVKLLFILGYVSTVLIYILAKCIICLFTSLPARLPPPSLPICHLLLSPDSDRSAPFNRATGQPPPSADEKESSAKEPGRPGEILFHSIMSFRRRTMVSFIAGITLVELLSEPGFLSTAHVHCRKFLYDLWFPSSRLLHYNTSITRHLCIYWLRKKIEKRNGVAQNFIQLLGSLYRNPRFIFLGSGRAQTRVGTEFGRTPLCKGC